jgi:hypothetical protein
MAPAAVIGHRRRVRRAVLSVGAEPGIVALAATFGVIYSVYAVLRHVHFQTGLDLSIFDQAVPMSRPESQRLFLVVVPWGLALNRFRSELGACAVRRQRRDPQAPRCFADAGAEFRARQRTLAAELTRLVPDLHGGCRQLASLALTFNDRLSSHLEPARRAGASEPTPVLVRALTRLKYDIEDGDYTGKLGHVFELCVPPQGGGG